jgi:hypothetical protein
MREEGEKSAGKKDGQYAFIRSMQGYACKCWKSEKSDGKIDMQYTFIRSMGGYI